MAKILVVDDSKIIRMQLKKMLSEIGHEILDEAEDGNIAYEKFIELNPDIITMDINMPNLDGLGAVKKIIAKNSEAKIIMISSIDDRTMTYECIGEGAMDFINKPIEVNELKTKIDSII